MKLNELKNKRILILGFGREGQDTLAFFKKVFPGKTFGIADEKPLKIIPLSAKCHFGKDYLKYLDDYDVIIKSPGIPFKNLPKSALQKIITQTDIFFDSCQGKIIGITGTKGKSTTSSLVCHILKLGGIKAHLVGNIGNPVLKFLLKAHEDDVFVYELSSHQLYNLKKSPHIAVFLNVFKEHLDYYNNFSEYARAKANITLYQTADDYLIFNSEDKIVKKFARNSKAKKIPIRGEYYELDRNAARAVAKIFNIPSATVEKAIQKFKYLPHRLELVGRFKEITFYNDSLATIPEATIAALDILGDKVETIILGGLDRNINFQNLAKKILKSEVKILILFPTTGKKIRQEIIKLGGRDSLNYFFVDNMEEAVRLAYKYTNKGKICLLSSASASFNLFKDYEERGNLFKKHVKNFSA